MGHEGMRSSLVSREVIADSVELTMRGHCYDALVGIAGCDKSLPGMMMAMLRLNVPSVFLYGGSIMPGRFHGKDVTVVDVFEGVGKYSRRQDGRSRSASWSRSPAPATAPAAASSPPTPWPASPRPSAWRCLIPRPARRNPRPRRLRAQGRRGGDGADREKSAPARHLHPQGVRERRHGGGGHRRLDQCGLHLPAMANECGIKFTLRDVAEIFTRTPYIAYLKPGGQYVAKDMCEAGGVPMLLQDPAGWRPAPRRLHDRHRQDHRREPEGREVQPDQKVIVAGEQPAVAHRRRGRPVGLAGARRRDRQGRRPQAPQASRPGAGVRRRGGLLRRRRARATTRKATCW